MGKIAGYVIAFFVCMVLLVFGGWAFKYFTAPIKGTVDAEVQIESAESRISNYNHFYDLCSQVQSMKQSIQNQKELLEYSDDENRQRVLANIAGMKSQLSRYVNQYNADASKSYTAARFRSATLPYKLYIDGTTNCQ